MNLSVITVLPRTCVKTLESSFFGGPGILTYLQKSPIVPLIACSYVTDTTYFDFWNECFELWP